MLANAVTATRIAASAAMLANSPADPVFWSLYAWCGISDIADGPIARKLGKESTFGAKLDSMADLTFAIVCCLRLLPECNPSTWLIAVIVVLATAKILLYALSRNKGINAHSKDNKAVGLAAFITLPVLFAINLSVTAVPACVLAAYSILQESRAMRSSAQAKDDLR